MRLSVAALAATLATLVGPSGARGDTVIAPYATPVPAAPAPPATTYAPAYRVESAEVRFTYFDQDGLGYQSAAGPAAGPGSERVTVEEPQAAVVAALGDRLVERIVTSVDVVTAASPDHKLYGQPVGAPVDAISSPSRINEAEEVDADSVYTFRHDTQLGFHADYHLEEPLESWGLGATLARALADDNTVVSASLYQIVDWFDNFDLSGHRHGRVVRATSNANLGVSQLLSPTTVVAAGYGFTIQTGTLTNTWNSVPLTDGTRGTEVVPRQRLRHALSARLAQWLPWEGALKVGYRFYVDSWGAAAHTVDSTLSQRFGPLTLEAGGRFHRQRAVNFFGTAFDPGSTGYRTADSDLDGLQSWAVSAGARWDQPIHRFGHLIYFALTGERYVRSNDLQIDLVSGAVGWQP